MSVREDEGSRFIEPMVWGISVKGRLVINLRTDSLAKGSFRKHLLQKRCLIPSDGFYEWRKEGALKIPVRFEVGACSLFSFPAIYQDQGEHAVRSFTLFTTVSNPLVSQIHNRMPVIIREQDEGKWLKHGERQADELLRMLVPFPADGMRAFDVSRELNNERNDGESLILPRVEKQQRLL